MGRNVSTLIGKFVPYIPQKCKDPGTFCVPCIIGNNNFKNAMLDLGASVSAMPLSIFNSLSLGPVQSTDVIIHLANRNVAYPTGFIEDVLVRVGELIFPVDVGDPQWDRSMVLDIASSSLLAIQRMKG